VQDHEERCDYAYMSRQATKVLLASDSAQSWRVVDSASTKWWQPTGINPLHPSGEPRDPLSVSKELQLGRQHAERSCRCRGFFGSFPQQAKSTK
jgi:hypothetical protein